MKTIEYLGQQCLELSNGPLRLYLTQSVGPRIILLTISGSQNLLAELPDRTIECPGKGDFHLYGGHRLWHAPEEPRRTYLPDDQPVEAQSIPGGVRLTQPAPPETGIQKEIKVRLEAEANRVQIEHILTNFGLWPVTCSPWAITQLRAGGVAFLPQNLDLQADNPTLPNRPLTLWPYTDINNPAITWGNDIIQVQAQMEAGKLKIGFPNPRGWLAYWLEGTLFVKRAAFDPQAGYFDFGSSSECYCNPLFIEMETLGPIATIQPGESSHHFETWELYAGFPRPEDLGELAAFIEKSS